MLLLLGCGLALVPFGLEGLNDTVSLLRDEMKVAVNAVDKGIPGRISRVG